MGITHVTVQNEMVGMNNFSRRPTFTICPVAHRSPYTDTPPPHTHKEPIWDHAEKCSTTTKMAHGNETDS